MTNPTHYRSECGTDLGWLAHRRCDERACQPCRKAIAIKIRDAKLVSLEDSIAELHRQGRLDLRDDSHLSRCAWCGAWTDGRAGSTANCQRCTPKLTEQEPPQ